MTTNQAFINEYLEYDMVFECLNEMNESVRSSVLAYNNAKRQYELKSFFEGADNDDTSVIYEAKGILETVGNAIANLIKKIAGVIKHIGEVIFGTSKKVKADTEIVNQMLIEHPELKNDIAEGIDKEWFTYKDVASYEKDLVGLYSMLKQNKIDHETFKDKVNAACDKFKASAKTMATISLSVVTVVGLFPKLVKAGEDNKKALSSVSKWASQIKDDYKDAYAEKDLNAAQAALYAVGKATGILTEEAKHNEAATTGLGGWINKLTKRAERHQKAKDKLDKEKKDIQNAKDDKEIKDYENKVAHDLEMEKRKQEVDNAHKNERDDKEIKDYEDKVAHDLEIARRKQEVDDAYKKDRRDNYYHNRLSNEDEKKARKYIDRNVGKKVYNPHNRKGTKNN